MKMRLVRSCAPFCVLLAVLVGFPSLGAGPQSPQFDRYFEARTMRLDYFHTGKLEQEIFSVERIVSDGVWAGSRARLIDDTGLGKYFFKVFDRDSGQLIYSRGFASIYGEWETTPEARSTYRTFHESLRFPWPRGPVRVVLEKWSAGAGFHEVWTTEIDPSSRAVNPADLPPLGNVWTLFENGPPQDKVDIVILGEGYTAEQMVKFHADARRLVDTLFAVEPFKSRRSDFNVRAIDFAAAESGVSRPHAGVFRRNPVSTQYSIFDTERYMLTYDDRALRDVLSAAPYDFSAILVNEEHYGGGGIYNFQTTSSVDSEFSPYVFIHEFGHHFGALGDEYYSSDVAYETGAAEPPEPWEPNVTALRDPAQLKWRDLVAEGTPLPTPWNQEAYDAYAREVQARRRELVQRQAPAGEFDALFREQREAEMRLLGAERYAGVVGAFRGAAYEPLGLYRPELDCIMFTRHDVGFCRVCRRAIERVIDLYASR
jgi:hypothetical protein